MSIGGGYLTSKNEGEGGSDENLRGGIGGVLSGLGGRERDFSGVNQIKSTFLATIAFVVIRGILSLLNRYASRQN